jgi:hypothetical protein
VLALLSDGLAFLSHSSPFIRPMGRLRRLVEGRLAVLARVAVGMHPDQTAAAAKPIGLSRSPGAL